MSTQADPTQEQIRTARRAGFNNSVAILPEDRRKRLVPSYAKQDARREKNVSGFYAGVLGKK
jgi:hypothetical protein